MEELFEKCKNIVNEVCEKYGYETQDRDGNKSLATVLKEIVPLILEDCSEEDRELFFQMLKTTPIEIVKEEMTQEKLDELINKHIKTEQSCIVEESTTLGEYGKGVAPAAYVSEAIINERLELIGKKSFVYVDAINSNSINQIYGTDINVAHLIHELGHAWNAQKKEYTLENGSLIARVGASELVYELKSIGENRYKKHLTSGKGIFIEEAMNTSYEEVTMSRYFDLPREEMKKIYKRILIPSKYQGTMTDMIDDLMDKVDENSLKHWRMHGDKESREAVEHIMEATEYWQNREKRGDNKEKRVVFAKNEKSRVQEFYKKYDDVFFPDLSQMTPMDKIDNVLEQIYDFSSIQYSYDILNEQEDKNYKEVVLSILREGYELINQSEKIKNEQGNKKSISDIREIIDEVSRTELEGVTRETRDAFSKEDKVIEQGEGPKDEH